MYLYMCHDFRRGPVLVQDLSSCLYSTEYQPREFDANVNISNHVCHACHRIRVSRTPADPNKLIPSYACLTISKPSHRHRCRIRRVLRVCIYKVHCRVHRILWTYQIFVPMQRLIELRTCVPFSVTLNTVT